MSLLKKILNDKLSNGSVISQKILNFNKRIDTPKTHQLSLPKDTFITELETKFQNIIFESYEEDNSVFTETDAYLLPYNKYRDDFVSDTIKPEPILSSKNSQDTVYPIKYQKIWNNYKLQQSLHWVAEEIDMSKDIIHWETELSHHDRLFIMHVLAFFAASDGIVNTNIKTNLIDAVKIKEAECAYGIQFAMENIHGEMYSIMLDMFVKDDVLKQNLINSVKTMPAIRKKAEWCKRWIDCDKTYAHKLLAFAIVEGVFFSGSFASIFWLKTRPGAIMPGLIKSNQFIARDEAQHVELACILYSLLNNKLKESVVYQIINEAIEYEEEFINSSLPCRLLGMNAELMTQYIKYTADRLLVQLGYNKLYNVTQPFEYMKKIDTFVKSNFFEDRNDAYSNSKINNKREFVFLKKF
jgi:ribonucleoside-diphosphate reductase beta chain